MTRRARMLTRVTDYDFTEIDLDDERRRRAAQREAAGRPANGAPLRVGGQTIANLPNEFPLDVLAPLRDLDEEITIVLRSLMQAWRAGGEDQRATLDAAQIIVDMLAVNPRLPTSLLTVLSDIATRLLTPSGFKALMDARLSREDYAFLIGRMMRYYGLNLGESSRLSVGGTEGSGEPSSLTSPASTPDSTPETSGDTPATPTSSESAAS